MNFTEFQKCSLNFILKFSTLILTKKYNHTSAQWQKYSTVTSQMQIISDDDDDEINVIRSQRQQQPTVTAI